MAYRSDRATAVNVVLRWKRGLSDRRDGAWFLVTNLSKGSAVAVTALYARRVAVEALFRDGKCGRYGFALRHTQVSRVDRSDRLVLASLLLTGLGLRAIAAFRPGEWSSVNRHTLRSAAVVGRTVREWFRLSPAAALQATRTAGANWV